jgi:hypothetical protein
MNYQPNVMDNDEPTPSVTLCRVYVRDSLALTLLTIGFGRKRRCGSGTISVSHGVQVCGVFLSLSIRMFSTEQLHRTLNISSRETSWAVGRLAFLGKR